MTAPGTLGRRQAAVLEHLAAHPGLTATELARAFGLRASMVQQMAALEQKALVVAELAWRSDQGRHVRRWYIAPPGTVPPPRPAPDPAEVSRRRERDTAAQRARRARRKPRRPPARIAPPALTGAACKGADTDLFFGPDAEFVTSRKQREAEAKAICVRCPVRDACLAYALDSRQEYGVWGGLNEDERRAILRPAAERIVSAAEARTWVTEIGYPAADAGPLQALHSHMPEPEPLPEHEPELEASL